MAILTIARLTLREASRRRLLIVVAILTLVMIGLTTWGFSRLPTLTCGRDNLPCPPSEIKAVTAALLILVAYMYHAILALGSVFIAAPAIAGEVESGVALAILPRPIRRSEVILGKWLALSLLVSVYAVVTGGLEFAAVNAVTGYLPPHPVEALLFLAGQSIVLLTFALLLSTRLAPMTTGVIAVVLFGLTWIGGIAESIGYAFDIQAMADAGTVLRLLMPVDGLWRGVIYYMEPAALLALGAGAREAAGNPFFVSAPPNTPYLIWAVAWVVGVLGLTTWSFARRDL